MFGPESSHTICSWTCRTSLMGLNWYCASSPPCWPPLGVHLNSLSPQINYLFQRRIPTVWNGIPLYPSFVWVHSYLPILSIYWARSYLIDPSSACHSRNVDSTSSGTTCNQCILLPNALGTHSIKNKCLNRTYFHANAQKLSLTPSQFCCFRTFYLTTSNWMLL